MARFRVTRGGLERIDAQVPAEIPSVAEIVASPGSRIAGRGTIGRDGVQSTFTPISPATGRGVETGILPAPVLTGPGRAGAFVQGGAERLINNVLGLPEFAAKLSRDTILPVLFGDLPDPQRSPNVLNLPSGREVLSGLDVALTGTTEEKAAADRAARESAHPGSFAAGEFGGDVATLAAGRLPRTGPGGLLDQSVQRALSTFSRRMGPASKGLKAAAKDIAQNPTFQDIARGVGRSAETGLEGMALSILQDGDPLETGALAAGAQLVSSASLTGAKAGFELPFKLLAGKPTGLSKAALGIGVNAFLATQLINLAQNIVPGGEDSPIEAQETAYEKILIGALAGMVIGLPGKRPKADGLLDRFPSVADAILTAPRTGVIKLAQAMAEDPDAERLVVTMGSTPEAFPEGQVKKLNKAVADGDISDVLVDILADERVAAVLEAPLPQLRDVPLKVTAEDGKPAFIGRVRRR